MLESPDAVNQRNDVHTQPVEVLVYGMRHGPNVAHVTSKLRVNQECSLMHEVHKSTCDD